MIWLEALEPPDVLVVFHVDVNNADVDGKFQLVLFEPSVELKAVSAVPPEALL